MNNKRNKNKKNVRNKKSVNTVVSYTKQMYVVMAIFLLIFLSMSGYFAWYIGFKSPDDINNSYNTRQEELAKKVVRGSILSKDRELLAYTETLPDKSEVRRYPYGRVFAHIVGYKDKGKSGIESIANISLLTSNTNIGDRIKKELSEEKQLGDNVITTLDVNLQKTASETLGVYKGAIIAMEPKSGKILAMVSNPGFDPNTIASDWDSLNEDLTGSPLINRATQGLYPPGSTFKIVTLLEYLREGGDTENYHFNCNGKFTLNDVTVNCYHGSNHGAVDLRKSFAKSCNSSFANIGSGLNTRSFNSTAADCLFNKELPLKLSYRKSDFELTKNSDTEEILHTAIGQGKTLISPMHMAMITGAIANGGVMMKPVIISAIENHEGAVVKNNKSEEYKRIMKEDEAAFLTDYMQSVILEGTGSKLSNLPYTVAGKTGSAEYGNVKGESHAWFTGFSNIENPELVVTVLVEGAGSGSDYAVPMAKRIFDTYYN